MKTTKKMISFRLDDADVRRLENLAALEALNVTALLRRLLVRAYRDASPSLRIASKRGHLPHKV